MASLADQIKQIQANIAAYQISLAEARDLLVNAKSAIGRAAATSDIEIYTARILELQAELSNLQTRINAAPSSSGDTTSQAQTARDDQANTTGTAPQQLVETFDGRIVPKTTITSTNANVPETISTGNADFGTDAESLSLTNSQSISSPELSGPLPNPPFLDPAQRAQFSASGALNQNTFLDPAQRAEFNNLQTQGALPNYAPTNNAAQGGVGARGDDAAQPVTNAVRNRLDELYGGAANAIISQDNILDFYASYTYSLSWYLVDPDTYNKLVKSPKRNLEGYYLLVQSGGAPVNNNVPNQTVDPQQAASTSGTVKYGRSPFFPLDYYIDNLEFNVAYAGVGSGGAATFSDLSFTVTEPNGISLLDNLYRAVADLYSKKNIVKPGTTSNYASAMYVMAIRFYGYDVNGQLVQPIGRRAGVTDNQAAVEKFIPFTLNAVDFKVFNKLVEYQIRGSSPGTATGFSTNRGSIPQNFQFQGTTVKDILVGSVIQQTASQAAGDQTRNGVPIQTSPPGSNNVQDPAQRAQALLNSNNG
jgi:hypothetical protein